MGIMRLARNYGDRRVEAACRRALVIGSPTYKSVASILRNGLDKTELILDGEAAPIEHDNIRGPDYYS